MSARARRSPTRSGRPSGRACWATSRTTTPGSASSPRRSASSPTANSCPPAADMQVFLQTFIGGLSLGAVYALVAMGFSLVYRTMGLVNFAHGNVVMIGAYLASTFYLSVQLPFAAALVSPIGVPGAVGVVIERVLRPLENKDFDLMLIGTIGFGIVLEALAIIIWGATGRAVRNPVQTGPLSFLGARVRAYDLVVLAVTALAMVLLVLFLQRTKRGIAMQAVAMDHEAATAVG